MDPKESTRDVQVQKDIADLAERSFKSVAQETPNSNKNNVSKRAWSVVKAPNFHLASSVIVAANAYNKTTNPQGIIDLGLSVNRLCEDILSDQLKESENCEYDVAAHHYFSLNGQLSFRQAIAEFMTDHFETRLPVTPDEIFVASGASGTLELLAFSLADPGDYFLSLRPYYSRIRSNLYERPGVLCYDKLAGNESDDVLPIKDRLNILYKEAKRQGKTVRGIAIVNPNNPTGEIYSQQELQDIVDFAHSHDLHVTSDEIYALSVFDEHAKFTSILAVPNIPNRSRIHVAWGFSKDFGLSGYRCGVLWTCNTAVLAYGSAVAPTTAVPLYITAKLEKLIRNKDWVDKVYLPTNRRRMRQQFRVAKDCLEALRIPVYPGKAGFAVWMDCSEFMKERTFQEERRLTLDFMKAGVYCLGGENFYSSQPGWFRMIFTTNTEQLNIALQRIKKIVRKFRHIESHL